MIRTLFAVAAAVVLGSGCSIGYRSVLMVTRSNFGVDVETAPPTAEVSISRQEGELAPSFEGGHKLPTLVGFQGRTGLGGGDTGNSFNNFLFGVSTIFAGGEAAEIATDLTDADSTEAICVSAQPVGRRKWAPDVQLPGPGEVKPFFIGTDSSLGVKVSWNGTTGQFPDSVKVGFQRKEFALAPIFASEGCGDGETGWTIAGPSFLAWTDHRVETGIAEPLAVKYAQGIATGSAATNLARVPEIKMLLLERTDPRLAERMVAQYGPDENTACIQQWIRGDRAKWEQAVREWWRARGNTSDAYIFIAGKDEARDRAAFVAEKGITCEDASRSSTSAPSGAP